MSFSFLNLPSSTVSALNQGLEFLKVATPKDKVGIVSDGVATPQRAPEGGLVAGQVAVPVGADVEPYVEFIIDTSAHAETVTDVEASIGDALKIHTNSCINCGASQNVADVIVGDATCNRYESFLGKLCSKPYSFAAMKVTVTKAATNSTANSLIALPAKVEWSIKNLRGEGPTGIIDLDIFEDLAAFPRTDVKYVNVPLKGQEGLFNNEQLWKLKGLQGGRIYKFTLFTGVAQA